VQPLLSADLERALILWLGSMAVLLMVASESVSPYYMQTRLLIDKKRLRRISLVLSILFLLYTLIKIYAIFTLQA